MGACAGKSNRPAVVVIKTKNKPTKQSNPENNAAFDEYDEPQIPQTNQTDPQQQPENPHPPQQDPQPEVQNNPPEERPVQKTPEKVFVSPARHEEKYAKDHGLEEADEDDFANRFNKKESPQGHNKGNHQEQNGGFMVNLPGSQVGNQHGNDANHFEESKKYESKNKDKNVRDIINNPDSLEHSMASPGTGLKKTLDQKPHDEFDAVLEDKQTHPHHAQNHQHRQSHFGTESQGNMNKEGVNKIDSASPMSGVLQNRGSATEKEKPVHHESPVRANKEKEMRMSDSVTKMESPEKVQMMRQSLEKMPWERNSVVRQEDDNEIEFFDDELEASKE